MATHATGISPAWPVSLLLHGEDFCRLSTDKINISRQWVCQHRSIRAPASLAVKKEGPLSPIPHFTVIAGKFRFRPVAQKSENVVPTRPSSLRLATLSLLAAPVLGATYLLIHATTVFVSAYRRGLGSVGGGANGGGRSGGGFSGGGGGGDSGSTLSLVGTGDEEAEVFVVVPALNEEACIVQTVRRLLAVCPPVAQVIVVDGGSTDETVRLARREGAIVVSSPPGRAKQMNEGAAVAVGGASSRGSGGSILCFVHADTLVPYDLVALLRSTLSAPATVCGGFVAMASLGDRILWGMSLQNCLKTWYAAILLRPVSFCHGFRVLFGDQVMFCRTRDFGAVGGFDASLPIMEDADLCDRLHLSGPLGSPSGQRGRIRMLSRAVYTSGRRLVELGPLRATYVHLVLGLRFAFGASPTEMHGLYKRLYRDIR